MPFFFILSPNSVKLRLLNSEQREEHCERILLQEKIKELVDSS
jgi:hypothetical protein